MPSTLLIIPQLASHSCNKDRHFLAARREHPAQMVVEKMSLGADISSLQCCNDETALEWDCSSCCSTTAQRKEDVFGCFQSNFLFSKCQMIKGKRRLDCSRKVCRKWVIQLQCLFLLSPHDNHLCGQLCKILPKSWILVFWNRVKLSWMSWIQICPLPFEKGWLWWTCHTIIKVPGSLVRDLSFVSILHKMPHTNVKICKRGTGCIWSQLFETNHFKLATKACHKTCRHACSQWTCEKMETNEITLAGSHITTTSVLNLAHEKCNLFWISSLWLSHTFNHFHKSVTTMTVRSECCCWTLFVTLHCNSHLHCFCKKLDFQ